ncbi:MAG: amidohydrolase family protein, partial [Gammaproteobacteria bacterium]|nr:amidohydrolase family protein [Gammaproteobacteria bacterium]
MKTLFAENVLLSTGWHQNVCVVIDDKGVIRKLTANRPCEAGAERLNGPVIPGMPNVHSHVWQRAFAGRTEIRGDFWAWRNAMYRYAQTLSPESLYAVAAQTYRDMLKAGYTWVGEFHYLHHAPDGSPYDNPAEMSEQVIQAALDVGIGITHLPVLYRYSNFGSQPEEPGQRRFVHDADGFLRLLDSLESKYASNPQVRIGCAPHSLRAIDPDLLAEVLANARGP